MTTLYPATPRNGRWLAVLPIEVHAAGADPRIVYALVDSGASRSVVPSTIAEQLGRRWEDLEPAGTSHGLGGPVEIRTLPGDLRLDGVTFASPIRVFPATGNVPAHLGADFLAHFDVALRLHPPEAVFMVAPAGLTPLPAALRVVVARGDLSRAERRRLARTQPTRMRT